jgi:hypothetical protein
MECRQIKDLVRASKQLSKLGRAHENENFENSRQTPCALEKTTSIQAEKNLNPRNHQAPI